MSRVPDMIQVMDIKKSAASTINKLASESTGKMDAASPTQKKSARPGTVKDTFEARKIDSFSGMNATAAPVSKLATQLTAAKQEITSYLAKGASADTNNIWPVMTSYLKLAQKEAKEEFIKLDVQNRHQKQLEEMEKAKEARERSSNALFETIFLGPLIGTNIGQPIGGPLSELKDHATRVKNDMMLKAQGESATEWKSRYQDLISWFNDQDK